MLKPNEIEAFSLLLDEQMRKLEMRVMSDIVRRIKAGGEITSSADRQISRLHELGTSKRHIRKYIKDSLQLGTQEINRLYKDVIRKGYALSESLYKYKGKPFIPFEENLGLQQLISSAAVQTSGAMRNITQSLGFAVRQNGGRIKFTELADYYQKTLDGAILDISSGAFDYNTVLKRVVGEMTDSGLRSVDYASGCSNRVDVAARRAVMTGMSQLTSKINDDNAKDLDTDMFEVTWHSGARPEHQVWQGRWYTRKQLEEICGLGTVTGLCGANCYHDYYPVIPGVSEPTYSEEELAELNAAENTPVEYGGRKYTKYEALQRQRRLETTMRAQRQKIKLLEDGGAAEEDIINARARYRATSAEYARFSKTMELPQQRERVAVDGLGNIGTGKYKTDSGKNAAVKSGGGTSSSGNAVEVDVPTPSNNGGAGKLYEPEKIPDKAVDNPGESGIIEENGRKAVTQITDSSIERVPNAAIHGYTDEQCGMIREQHRELLRHSRDNNNNNEVAFVFDSEMNDRKVFIGSDDRLDFGSALYGKDLFVMHNHPRNSSYSDRDIRFIIGNDNIKTLSIVKNNGNVEILTKSDIYDKGKALVELKRCYKKYVKHGTDEEINKAVSAFLKNNKGLFEWIKT